MKKFLFLYKGYMPPTPEIGKHGWTGLGRSVTRWSTPETR